MTVPQDNATYAVDPERLRVLKRYPVGDVAGAVSPDGRLVRARAPPRAASACSTCARDEVRRFRGRHDAAVEAVSFTPGRDGP